MTPELLAPVVLAPVVLAPVVLPAASAALMLLVARGSLGLQRVVSVAGVAGLIAAVVALSMRPLPVAEALGNWPAPFGIVLIADPLAVLMLALVAGLGGIVLVQVILRGVDREGPSFHPLFQFLLMGLNGAFLTGDAFTLFVCFEVLLIASYGLAVHGGGAARLRAGMRYVVTNLVGSTLFLIGLGVVYGVTGTLNMADLSVKVAALPAGDQALIRVAAVMLGMVFALKAALVPLHVWLPGTYAQAPAVVAAMFAVMTKVGAYATLRFGTLVFPAASIGPLLSDLLLPAALVTLIVGAAGMLAAGPVNRIAAYAAIASTGTLFIALSAFTPEAVTAALYYLVHSTLAVAALFLLADLIPAQGRRNGPLAAFYFVTAIAIAGMPPLSGFLGKLLILQAQWQNAAWVWPTILATSLMIIIALARAGSDLFWKPQIAAETPPFATLAAPALLLAALASLTLAAGPATEAFAHIAASLFDPTPYLAAQGITR